MSTIAETTTAEAVAQAQKTDLPTDFAFFLTAILTRSFDKLLPLNAHAFQTRLRQQVDQCLQNGGELKNIIEVHELDLLPLKLDSVPLRMDALPLLGNTFEYLQEAAHGMRKPLDALFRTSFLHPLSPRYVRISYCSVSSDLMNRARSDLVRCDETMYVYDMYSGSSIHQ